jgi:hypothetical protein
MDCVVLVPRRPEPWRDALWEHVRAHVEPIGWEIREGLSLEGAFNRSAAINEAADCEWDVAAILDADTLIDLDQLRAAAEFATKGKLVVAHTAFRSLSKESSRQVIREGANPADLPVRWVTRNTKSSALCVGRKLWEEARGFDPAFEGWGFEDAAFYATCQALRGIERVDGPIHHLWHPRSPEKNSTSPDYIANRERAARYKRAASPGAMRKLLKEIR